MKKILSIVVVLSMLFTACFMLFSCNTPDGGTGLSVNDLKDNEKQMDILAEGADKTVGAFFSLADVESVLKGMKKGAVTIDVDNAMLESSLGIGRISETLYFDTTSGVLDALVSDTAVEIGEESYSGKIFIDQNNIGIISEALLGSNDAYKINISNLKDNFMNSPLKDEIPAGEVNLDQIGDLLLALEDIWELCMPSAAEGSYYNDMMSYGKKLLADAFEAEVTEATVDGKAVITVTYTINNETYAEYIRGCNNYRSDEYMSKITNLFNAIGDISEEDVEELLDMIAERDEMMIEQMNEAVVMDMTVSMSVEKDGGALIAAAMKGSVTPAQLGAEGAMEVDVSFSMSATRLEIVADLVMNGSMPTAFDASIVVTREEKNGQVIFNGDVDAAYEMQGAKMELADLVALTVTYDQNDGALTLAATVNAEQLIGSKIEATLEGTLFAKDGKVTLGIDSVEAMGFGLEDLGVTVVIDPNAAIPTLPDDTTEVLSMTLEELQAVASSVQESPLAGIFGSMGNSGTAEPDDNFTFRLGSYTNGTASLTFLYDGSVVIVDENGEISYAEYELGSEHVSIFGETFGATCEYYGDAIEFFGEIYTYQYD